MDRRDFLKGIGAGLAGAFVATGTEAKDKLLDEADHILDHDLGCDEEERWREEYYRVCGRPVDGRDYPTGEVYGRGPMHNAFKPMTATECLRGQEEARELWRKAFDEARDKIAWEMNEKLLNAILEG